MIKKSCTRFSDMKVQDKFTEQNALIYLELRDQKCPKSLAKKFCSKPVCKFDTTQKIDGPVKFRILKVKSPKKFATHLGWQYTQPEYELSDNRINCLTQFTDQTKNSYKLESQFNKNCSAKQPKWELEQRVKTMYDVEMEHDWGLDLRDENKLKLLRDKSMTLEQQNTEFFYRSHKFQSISNLLMKDRIEGLQSSTSVSQKKFQSFTFFDPILSDPDLLQVKIQQFNKREKQEQSSPPCISFDCPPQQQQPTLRTQESLPANFLTEGQMGQDELYNMITEQSDEEVEDQSDECGVKKRRIKDVLMYGFKQKLSLDVQPNYVRKSYTNNTYLKNTSTPECKALIHNYISDVNSKYKYTLADISSVNIQDLARQRESLLEKAKCKLKSPTKQQSKVLSMVKPKSVTINRTPSLSTTHNYIII